MRQLIVRKIHKEFGKTIHDELFEGKTVTISETERHDATCLGIPGSAVTSAVQIGASLRATLETSELLPK